MDVEDTPLSFSAPGTDWEQLTGTLRKGFAEVPIGRIMFWAYDPRVLLIPVDAAQVKAFGV